MLTRMMHGVKSLESISTMRAAMECRTSTFHTSAMFNNMKKSKKKNASQAKSTKTIPATKRTSPLLEISDVISSSLPESSAKSTPTVETSPLSEKQDNSTPMVCFILESDVHRALLKELNMDSITNLIVGYILASDIMVERVALECNVYIVANDSTNIEKSRFPVDRDPNLKVSKFSVTDDTRIEHNWKCLMDGLNLEEEHVINEVFENIIDDKNIWLKRNVIGYYLSQGLTSARLATEVFHRALNLKCLKTGKFSAEEDQIILDFVQREGRKFAKLGKLLRRRSNSVSVRHQYLDTRGLNSKDGTRFTLEEDKLIITEVFAVAKNFLHDQKIKKKDWKEIGKKLQRNPQSAYNRWKIVLEPMLKKYHAGSLYVDEKEVLINHMVEHDMDHAQDVDWKALVKLPKFAGTSTAYLQNIHKVLRDQTKRKHPELSPQELTSKAIQIYLNKCTRRAPRKNKEENQEKLINFYRSTVM